VVLQLGRYHLYTPEAHSQEFQVYQIKLHPQYDPSTLENDIAITKLANAITFNSYIQPICLWDSSRTSLRSVEHKVGTVMGWGYTEEDEASDVLKGGTMPVVPFEDCLTSAREFFGHFLSDKNYCAGFRNGTSVCNGDSGGGMIFEINNVWYIRGVVSLSMKREKDNLCNTKNYVLFTDVAKYLDWIESESI
jgi:secreted trypsin-like serine protease